jgi:thioredoxin-dependent peroxiredoxin
MNKLKQGSMVPAFKAINQIEKEVTQQDFLGTKTVLYFYPKDGTPTCTVEACNLRDNYHRFIAEGYQVLGISPDTAKKHRSFIEKHDLPFDLLVDEDHKIAEMFGVWAEKQMYGRKYMGILRTTFVINEQGVIDEVIEKVRSKEHTEQLLG